MKSKVFTKVEANDFIRTVETTLNGLHRARDWQEKQGQRDLAKKIEDRRVNLLNVLGDLGLRFCHVYEKECATCDPFVCYHFVEYEGYKGEEK